MSARYPVSTSRIYTFHGMPEAILGIAWERGYETRLVNPEIQAHTIEVEINCNRAAWKDIRAEDARRVDQYRYRDHTQPFREAWAKLTVGMNAEEQEALAKKHFDFMFSGSLPSEQERRGVIGTRVYFEPDTIKEVIRERGLSGKVVTLKPYHCFRVVNVSCDRNTFRAAQFEWLQKMMKNPPTPIRCDEITEELF